LFFDADFNGNDEQHGFGKKYRYLEGIKAKFGIDFEFFFFRTMKMMAQ
jgi:hypothetical protein